MKLSLLEMTQNILSSMNSEEVNSIGDTPEAMQVANIIKTTYINMLGRYELPEHVNIIQLNASDDPTVPVLLKRPDHITRIEWVKYFNTNPADGNQFTDQFGAYSKHGVNTDLQQNANGWSATSVSSVIMALGVVSFQVSAGIKINIGDSAFCQPNGTVLIMSGIVTAYSGTTLTVNITNVSGGGTFTAWTISQINPLSTGPGYQEVQILPVKDFINMVSQFNINQDDVRAFDLAISPLANEGTRNFTFYYKNDKQPQYCCILGNYYIVFDSYDNTQDSTLQSSKSMAYAWISPNFVMEDTFVPILDDQQFPLLLNTAKAWASWELKQQRHPLADDEEAKQLFSVMKWKALSDHPTFFEELSDFGRRGRGWY